MFDEATRPATELGRVKVSPLRVRNRNSNDSSSNGTISFVTDAGPAGGITSPSVSPEALPAAALSSNTVAANMPPASGASFASSRSHAHDPSDDTSATGLRSFIGGLQQRNRKLAANLADATNALRSSVGARETLRKAASLHKDRTKGEAVAYLTTATRDLRACQSDLKAAQRRERDLQSAREFLQTELDAVASGELAKLVACHRNERLTWEAEKSDLVAKLQQHALGSPSFPATPLCTPLTQAMELPANPFDLQQSNIHQVDRDTHAVRQRLADLTLELDVKNAAWDKERNELTSEINKLTQAAEEERRQSDEIRRKFDELKKHTDPATLQCKYVELSDEVENLKVSMTNVPNSGTGKEDDDLDRHVMFKSPESGFEEAPDQPPSSFVSNTSSADCEGLWNTVLTNICSIHQKLSGKPPGSTIPLSTLEHVVDTDAGVLFRPTSANHFVPEFILNPNADKEQPILLANVERYAKTDPSGHVLLQWVSEQTSRKLKALVDKELPRMPWLSAMLAENEPPSELLYPSLSLLATRGVEKLPPKCVYADHIHKLLAELDDTRDMNDNLEQRAALADAARSSFSVVRREEVEKAATQFIIRRQSAHSLRDQFRIPAITELDAALGLLRDSVIDVTKDAGGLALLQSAAVDGEDSLSYTCRSTVLENEGMEG